MCSILMLCHTVGDDVDVGVPREILKFVCSFEKGISGRQRQGRVLHLLLGHVLLSAHHQRTDIRHGGSTVASDGSTQPLPHTPKHLVEFHVHPRAQSPLLHCRGGGGTDFRTHDGCLRLLFVGELQSAKRNLACKVATSQGGNPSI